MIVRDEEALLDRFLAHARGAYDELVAVDTGSTDRTPAILESAGARVVREPWTQDFAAPRNVGLALARGDWILVLDADELAPPELGPRLRAIADDPSAGAATLLLRDRLPHGHVRETRLLRAFRRSPAVRFRHAIHEDIVWAVEAELARTGQRLLHVPHAVEHLGYVRSRAALKSKKARDLLLLERCLADDPLDLYSHFKRLEQARYWGDAALWAHAAVDALRAMEAAPAPLSRAHFGGELAALVADGLHRAAPARALAMLDAWERRVRPSAAFHLRRGELREVTHRPDAAAEDFSRCLSLARETSHVQLASVRPLLGLARLALARGDLADALRHAEAGAAQAPRDPEALLALAALHRARGGRDGLRALLEQRVRDYGEAPELRTAIAEEALRAGDPDLAASVLSSAHAADPAGRPGLLLARALLATGDVAGARALAARLSAELPEAGLGTLLCDLIEGRDSDLELDLEPDQVERAMREWIDPVLRAHRPELVQRLRESAPAVATVFPWLERALGEDPSRRRQAP